MSTTRRDILRQGSIAAAFAMIPSAFVPLAHAVGLGSGAAGMPTKDQFLSLQGATFRVSAKGAKTQWLTLVSVDDLPAAGPINTTAFAVRFYGGSGKCLTQNTYTFTNTTTGKFQLFIVPSGDEQRFYTAIFNLL